MSFTFLSPLSVALGLAGLAGVLFLLQRLRVRHREVDVVTTLFWREAVLETRARVLVRRFRHPLAYLLLLAIASLLWLALAGPKRAASGERQYVCLLDASAGMGHGRRFEEAAARVVEVADELPAERRRVLSCGESTRTLLAPGEETLLLEARLEGVAPSAAPASLASAIEDLAAQDGETTVFVFGDAPLDEARLALLPESVVVERVELGGAGLRAGNRGITALGVSPAASGSWDAVDVLVELSGYDLAAHGELGVRLDGEGVALSAETTREGERTRTLLFHDVPARGQRFEVSLDGGDDLALDDRAAIRLPDRPLLRVGLSASLDGVLRSVLEADPATVIVDGDADVYLAREGDAVPDGAPALRFVPLTEQDESFLVTFAEQREPEGVLFDLVGALGLEEIDPTALAEAARRPITLGARRGDAREVAVWAELLGEEYDFTDSRRFPLFIARCLRWLTDAEALRPWASAGEALRGTGVVFATAEGRQLDPVGVSFTPPVAGDYLSESGEELTAALASREATLARPLEGLSDPTSDVDGDGADWVTWLLALAGVLLLAEWALVRAGRMP